MRRQWAQLCALVLLVGLSLLGVSCGSSSETAISIPTPVLIQPTVAAQVPARAILGLVDPAGSFFPTGSAVEIFASDDRGQPLPPALGTGQLDAGSRFQIEISALPDLRVLIARVSGSAGQLRGYIINNAVEISPWSEALVQVIGGRTTPFGNYVPTELQELLRVLQTQVPLPTGSPADAATIIAQTGRTLLNQLLTCYAPVNDQTNQGCSSPAGTRLIRNQGSLGLQGGQGPRRVSNIVVLRSRA